MLTGFWMLRVAADCRVANVKFILLVNMPHDTTG